MSRLKTFSKYWLPVLLWALLIFSASSDQKSAQRSSRIIDPIVRWLFPKISEEAVQTTVFVVRKIAHVTEFAIFTLLIWRASRAAIWGEGSGWNRKAALFAFLCAVLFAVSDEIHQMFVPGRQSAVVDVLIDSAGAAGGLFCVWGIMQTKKYRSRAGAT